RGRGRRAGIPDPDRRAHRRGHWRARAGGRLCRAHVDRAGRTHGRRPGTPRAPHVGCDVGAQTGAERGQTVPIPRHQGGQGLSKMALLKVLERMGRGDLTSHGFRATFKTWATERTNFPRELVEAALAHVLDDKTEATYQRGDMLQKRRRLMDAWADFCAKRAP